MKGKRIKGNVCTAAHLHPPFLSSSFEIVLHLLLFTSERLWKSISISALYRSIMWWWSCYICINVPFSTKVFKFQSLFLLPVPLFYMHMHHKYADTNQLLLFLGKWSVFTQHSVTFEHYSYFTKSAFTVSRSLAHSWSYHCRLTCVAILVCFNGGDIFWSEFDRTHKWTGWAQVGPGTGNSRTTWLMEGQLWNHTLNRIKSLTEPGGQGAQRPHRHQ